MNWYAAKVFFNRTAPLIAELDSEGTEYFWPREVIPSLLFIHTTQQEITQFGSRHYERLWVYKMVGTRTPSVIPDREMEVFRFVVTAGRDGLELLGDDKPEYHEGDRVVVTGGPFKGAEGHIKRIKKDRRLVVTIRGVVAVATTFIHPSLLKRVDEPETQVGIFNER